MNTLSLLYIIAIALAIQIVSASPRAERDGTPRQAGPHEQQRPARLERIPSPTVPRPGETWNSEHTYSVANGIVAHALGGQLSPGQTSRFNNRLRDYAHHARANGDHDTHDRIVASMALANNHRRHPTV